ncbi:glycoside hydrolase family 5 protein [Haloferula sargassicola]|uniref:Glycoside hydrolase family 5 domain-containing protein n=1 Tax=Haloferula sargassicola TaxID=490096 RepID=A0ABP9UR57_9BACT
MKSLMVFLAGVVMAEEPPVKLAEQARLQLKMAEGGQVIDNLALTVAGAWMDPGPPGETRDLTFPIDAWQWTAATLRFTPPASGKAELSFIGPWEEQSTGVVWRQEILWDDVEAEGSSVTNGSFSAGIEGWTSPWAPFPPAADWPLAGREVGASWLGRPLVQQLTVEGGKPVTLRFRARAAAPSDRPEMHPVSGKTPAHDWAAALKRGVNLGNCWEAPVGSWGVPYGPEDIDRIADAGFDHIRVPVGWHHRIENGEISPGLLEELEPVLKQAEKRKLHMILDWHGFKALEEDPDGHRQDFIDGWKTIAAHFKAWSPLLAYELLNEPTGGLHGSVLNDLHQQVLTEIRAIDPERIVFLDPGRWAVADQLGQLWIPQSEKRVILTFHCYDPFPFTHQKAAWVGFQSVEDIRFPGPPSSPAQAPVENLARWYAAYSDPEARPNPSSISSVERLLDKAKAWSENFGRPVHLGEFGCVRDADPASRRRYARQVRDAAEKRDIPWSWWEWKVGFGVVDMQTGEPLLIDALTGD